MTLEWQGTSTYGPGDAVNFIDGRMGVPQILALSNGKVLIDWVAIDQTNTVASKHCAAVGSIIDGAFVPDTEVMITQSIVAATGSPIGGSSAYEDSGGLFFVSYLDDGTGNCRMVIARTSLALDSITSKVVNITDGSAQPYLRHTAVAFDGHYFRLALDPGDGVTVTVRSLDSSFNDGATATFTIADAFAQLGTVGSGAMVSGPFACFSKDSFIEVMAHFDGAAIDDVWTRSGASIIRAADPTGSGRFVTYDGSLHVISVATSHVETVTAGPYAIVVDIGASDAAQAFTDPTGGVWSFETGSGGGG